MMIMACCMAASYSSAQSLTFTKGFTENKGQVCDQLGHANNHVIASRINGNLDVFLNTDGFSYQINKISGDESSLQEATVNFHRIDVKFNGMSSDMKVEWKQRSGDFENFIVGSDAGAKEIYNVYRFSSVVYHSVYEGVDVEFLTDESTGEVKFNFMLKHASDIAKIRLQYEGQLNSEVLFSTDQASTEITLNTSLGELKESVPSSYFLSQDKKIPVEIGYRIEKDGIVGFEFKKATVCLDCLLVIDPTPTISWSTYFGGTAADQGLATELDGLGYVFMGGITSSSSGIATAGAHQGTYGGSPFNDGFISKFDYNGLRIWSTYFGGTNDDQLFDLATDGSGNIFFTGTTSSTNAISTAGAYQVGNAGNADAFIAKLNSAGVLQWSTYYGGTQSDAGRSIYVSGTNVYVGGSTTSTTGIATAGAHITAYIGGASDGFVAQFSTSGTLNWATYFGGTLADAFYGIAVNSVGNVYAAGTTNSSSGISTAGAHQTAPGGNNDAMIASFDATGSLLWSTYMGGTLADNLLSLSIDVTDNLLLTGQTYSSSGMATAGAYDTSLSGSSDGFVALFTSAGSRIWSTYVGGNVVDQCYFSGFDSAGNVYVGGHTSSTSGLATASSAQSSYGGGAADAFISQFNSAGTVQWITYLGGSGDDYGRGGSVDVVNGVFMTGMTTSTGSISTAGAYQSSIAASASTDAFLIRYGANFLLPVSLIDFVATPDQENVLCSWTVSNNEVCYQYLLDRSHNGQDWLPVAELDCDASWNGQDYQINDRNPLDGYSYYRLTQQDLNGAEHQSRIASVYFGSDNQFVVFPIPASDVITAKVFVENDQMVLLKMFNGIGREVYTQRIQLVSGNNVMQFSLDDISAGFYELQIRYEDGTLSNRKFIRSAR